MSLKDIVHDLCDIIFPPQCLTCTEIIGPRNKEVFCSACAKEINLITGSLCPVCGVPFPDSPADNHVCGKCLEKRPFFAKARSVAVLESVVMEAIHNFKYGRSISAGRGLTSFMADFSFPDFDFSEYSLIVPVPLHIKKLRERGFNQSLILAGGIAKKYGIPVNFSLLKRRKFTLTQTGLHKTDREKNVRGAFIVADRRKIKGENIIIIDDVYTTGATINECARVLLRSGARKVSVLTLAHATEKSPAARSC